MAKILIFDDSIEMLEMLQAMLQYFEYSIVTANTSEKFMQELQQHPPDLILLDVSLGVTDGRLICLKLKSVPATEDIPIILMSANPTLLVNYKEFCADAAVEKPFDMDNLVQKINSLIR